MSKNDSWLNTRFNIPENIYTCLLGIILAVVLCLIKIPTLECHTQQDYCSLSEKSIINGRTELRNFKISDIKDFEINKHKATNKGLPTYYTQTLYLKTGGAIYLDFPAKTEERAKEIIYNIKFTQDYTINGSLLKHFYLGY